MEERFSDPSDLEGELLESSSDPNKTAKTTADISRTLQEWISSRAVNGNPSLSKERSIVWPPVVIIENIITGFNKTTNKWEGLGNNEIKSFLKTIKDLEYKKVSAVYNHKGHRGIAAVIFEANDLGFMNAETLSQCLQRAGRGREDWLRVRPRGSLISEHDLKKWNTGSLVADDGKRTIYGYLAMPADLNYIKSAVNKLTVESYVKKVLEPMNQRYKANEIVNRDIQMLEEEAKQKTEALEFEKFEINQVAAELKKKDEEIRLYRKQEEEAEALHRSRMEENKRRYEMEKQHKRLQYEQREAEIRGKLLANKQHFEKETEEYIKAALELEQGIQKEKKEQELRLAETRKNIAMRQMRLESELAAKMEKKFAELEERLNKKKLELQTKHHQEILQFKENSQKEREQMLQKKLAEQRELETQVEIAKNETERLASAANAGNEEAVECAICSRKFGPEVSRALYEGCGHMNVCVDCAKKQWVKNKGICPICKGKQGKKFVVVPFKIYC